MKVKSRFFEGLFVGSTLATVLCVSFIEVIHRTIEVKGVALYNFCSIIYDELEKRWHPDFVYGVKVVYKTLAFPARTLWIYLSDREVAIKDGETGRFIFDGLMGDTPPDEPMFTPE